MRLKGINPIEQHFEKIIAGVFGVGLLGVVAWQFIGVENKVKVGKDEVPIDQAYSTLERTANAVKGKLEAVNVPKPEGTDVGTASLKSFQDRFKGPVAPAPALVAALDRSPTGLVAGGSGGGEVKAGATYAALQLPKPAAPIVATHLGTIDESEVREFPEVASVLPKEQPFDKAGVTVETTIDGTQIKAALLSDPDGDGPIQAIPARWWESVGVQILGVELERETMQADGTFSQSEVVKAMPGRQSLASPAGGITTATGVKDAMKLATDSPERVRRPEYYRVRFGEAWTPPSERQADTLGGPDEKSEVQRDIEKLEKDKKRYEDLLSKQPAGGGGGAGGRTPPPPPGGGRGPSGPGGGGGGPGTPPGGGPKPQDDQKRKDIEKKLERTNDQLTKLNDRLAELEGRKPSGQGDTNQPGGVSGGVSGKGPSEKPLLEDAKVRVWSHDVHVERGKTYRYRVMLVVNNVYFGHSAAMLPAQASLASGAVMRTPASDWSEVVRVEQDNFLFITSASEDDQGGRTPSAKAEVYVFKWGYWRKGDVSLEPGDTVKVDVKYPDMLKVLAMTPDAGSDPAGGGGGKGSRPGSDREREGERGVPGSSGEKEKGKEAVPMATLAFERDSLLVGVSDWAVFDQVSGRGVSAEQVLLREPDGQVFVRIPRQERDSAEYRRVASNAQRGEKELKPNKVEGPDKAPAPPSQPVRGGGPSGG